MNRFFMPVLTIGLALPLGGCPLSFESFQKTMAETAVNRSVCQSLPTTEEQIKHIDRAALLGLVRTILHLDNGYWPVPLKDYKLTDLRRQIAETWVTMPDGVGEGVANVRGAIDRIEEDAQGIRKNVELIVDQRRILYRKGAAFPMKDDASGLSALELAARPVRYSTQSKAFAKFTSGADPNIDPYAAAFRRLTDRYMVSVSDGVPALGGQPYFANTQIMSEIKSQPEQMAEADRQKRQWAIARAKWALERSLFLILTSVVEIEQNVVSLLQEAELIRATFEKWSTDPRLDAEFRKNARATLGDLEKFKSIALRYLATLEKTLTKDGVADVIEKVVASQDDYFETLMQREAGRLTVRAMHRAARGMEAQLDKLSTNQTLALIAVRLIVAEGMSAAVANMVDALKEELDEVSKVNHLGDHLVYGMAIGACSRLDREDEEQSEQSLLADLLLEPVYDGMLRVYGCLPPRNEEGKRYGYDEAEHRRCLNGEVAAKLPSPPKSPSLYRLRGPVISGSSLEPKTEKSDRERAAALVRSTSAAAAAATASSGSIQDMFE